MSEAFSFEHLSEALEVQLASERDEGREES